MSILRKLAEDSLLNVTSFATHVISATPHYTFLSHAVSSTIDSYTYDSEACHHEHEDNESSAFVDNGGFILLFIAVLYSLWAISYCCEDFFVPALEVLCKEHKIPDSAAGAIVMAAGNDFPELFISALGLFVEKSALGVGTVIGSEIFNHMCITAGACLYAKNGCLKVKPREFTRDCAGYMSSLVVLCFVVGANLNHVFEPSKWGACLVITTESCYVLIGFQVAYCLIVIYFKRICALFGVQESSIKHIFEVKGSISHIMHETVNSPNTEAEVILDEMLGLNPGKVHILRQFSKGESTKYRTHRFNQRIPLSNPEEITGAVYSELGDDDNISGLMVEEEAFRSSKAAEGKDTANYGSSSNSNSTSIISAERMGELDSISTATEASLMLDTREYYVYHLLEYLELATEPLRYLIFNTLYDTTEPANENKYMHTIIVCILWMGLWVSLVTLFIIKHSDLHHIECNQLMIYLIISLYIGICLVRMLHRTWKMDGYFQCCHGINFQCHWNILFKFLVLSCGS